ncbi:phosphatase PAP2 family protein [Pseudonocardia sp. CA-107938]|uniref:phosphatase PAP2 family protein n=1 Tax=Pseudonocardia sp. CA-107938 TaxID=3240021 RepID=UPI003D8D9838
MTDTPVRQTRSSGPRATAYPAHRVLLVVLAGAAGVLTGLVVALWVPLAQFDEMVVQSLNAQVAPHAELVTLLGAVTDVGSETAVWVLTGVVVVAALLLRRYRAAGYLVACWLLEFVVENGLKHGIGRPRPVVPVELVHATTGSYPSGHTMGITVACVSVTVLLLGSVDRRWWRWLLVVGSLVVMAVVAATRVLLAAHYPSDVVGAMLLGTVLALALVPIAGRPDELLSRPRTAASTSDG